MNKIFKTKRNHLGQSVVCSEIAKSCTKGKLIATALTVAIASVSGTASALTDDEIKGFENFLQTNENKLLTENASRFHLAGLALEGAKQARQFDQLVEFTDKSVTNLDNAVTDLDNRVTDNKGLLDESIRQAGERFQGLDQEIAKKVDSNAFVEVSMAIGEEIDRKADKATVLEMAQEANKEFDKLNNSVRHC